MINDALASVKSSLTFYSNTISECANPSLRSTIQQIRDKCEVSQYELYKLAETKGFYKPAVVAKDDEVQQTRMELQS